MIYHFKVHKEKKGFWAEGIELTGCRAQGENLEDLRRECEEALNLYLDEPHDSKEVFSLPHKSIKNSKGILEIEVNPQVAFSFLMRRTRLTLGFTQHQMKDHLDFRTLFSYQKLERSKTANPTLKSLMHILKRLPNFPVKYLI